MRFYMALGGLVLWSSAALAQGFSQSQIDAVEDFWDVSFACAEEPARCTAVGPAVRAMVAAGLCPEENSLVPCEQGSIPFANEAPEVAPPALTQAAPEPAAPLAPVQTMTPAAPAVPAAGGIPPVPAGLVPFNTEVFAAIARDECLSESGFVPCRAYSPPRLAANGHLYEGVTVDETRLLTRWIIYVEECRGGMANNGWCVARDEAQAALAAGGLCLLAAPVNGFRSCAPAGSTPLSVPFDDAVMRAAFSARSPADRQYMQNMISAGSDGVYGPRTAEALRNTARLLEDLTRRDPQAQTFDLTTSAGAGQYLDVLMDPLTEVYIWGGH